MGLALPPLLTAAFRELGALGRQAWLLPRDAWGPLLPARPEQAREVVVFLHGLFASAGIFRPLRLALWRRLGVEAAALSYVPGPSVEALAQRVDQLIARLPSRARLHLVGHSLGGVVARYHAQTREDPRVVQTISLASPFAGVSRAHFAQLAGASELGPRSELLRSLRTGSLGRAGLAHLSIQAERDLVVPGGLAQALPGFPSVLVRGVGHNALLYTPEVLALLVQRLRP